VVINLQIERYGGLTIRVSQNVNVIFKKVSIVFVHMGKYQNDVFPELSTEQLLKQTEHVLGICIQSNQVFGSDKDVLIWIARAGYVPGIVYIEN